MTMFDPVNLQICEVMTSEVYIIQPDTTLQEARRIFDTHGFHHLPVVEEGRVVGMLSKSDVMLVSTAFPIQDSDARNEKNAALLSKLLAEEVMTRQVVKLKPDMTLGVAVGIFLENLFHALPVVDEEGQLVGIISLIDLIRVAYVPQPHLHQ
jgi:CBS domain-containing protein